MTTAAHPGRTLYVQLPVADPERSTAFFAQLGFRCDPELGDGNAACVRVGEQAVVMLLGRETFAQYAHLPTGDPTTHAQALYCFGVSTREEVDTVVDAAAAAGASESDGPEDHGFMYTRSFVDLDGHPWQVVWMDPAATQRGAGQPAASPQDAVA